jgi:putative membrane protein
MLIHLYPWILSLHVISLIAWMAGMFYLPRLYVYHCQLAPGSAESERFKVMERRLLKQIMTPAMMATWFFGILLVLTPGIITWTQGWWYVKLVSVLMAPRRDGAAISSTTATGGRSVFTVSPMRFPRFSWLSS